MTRTYYTLLTRLSRTSPWGVEFGDYSLTEVEFEAAELRYTSGERGSNLRILITTDDTQASIDAAVATLNARLPASILEG